MLGELLTSALEQCPRLVVPIQVAQGAGCLHVESRLVGRIELVDPQVEHPLLGSHRPGLIAARVEPAAVLKPGAGIIRVRLGIVLEPR